QATTELAGGIPFISDADLQKALDEAHVSNKTAEAIVDENSSARLAALQAALGVVALIALVGLFCAGGIPKTQPKSAPEELFQAPETGYRTAATPAGCRGRLSPRASPEAESRKRSRVARRIPS